MQKSPMFTEIDSLNLSKEISLKSLLPADQSIRYSAQVQKFNQNNKAQTRIFLLTDKAIYNLIRRQNIIKSLMSKLVNLKNTFTIRRRIKLDLICGITISREKSSQEFIVHINKEHDYRYRTSKKIPIIKAIVGAYIKHTNKKMAFYFKDDIILVDYCTTKIHLKDKVCLKPKQEPLFFDVNGVEAYELPKIKFELVYSFEGKEIPIQKFEQHKTYELNPDFRYYTITTVKRNFDDILPFFEHKRSVFVNLPHFCYTTKNKTHLIRPFMLGGKLSTLLSEHGPFSPQLAKFYTSQMILALEFFHSCGFVYRTLSLDKIYLHQNGYISLEGLQSCIIKHPQGKMLYSINGLPSFMAPEMVSCLGYSYEADIWSLGVCILLMLTGKNPYLSFNVRSTLNNVMCLDTNSLQNLPSFLHKIFKRDPKQRIKLSKLKQEQWFSDINWEEIKQQRSKPVHRPKLGSIKDWSGKLPSIIYIAS